MPRLPLLLCLLLPLPGFTAEPATGDPGATDDIARIEAQLAEQPGDPVLQLRLAQHLGWKGRNAAALELLDSLCANFPQDADCALIRAHTLRRLHRTDDALNEARRAAALAPDYEDARRLEFALAAQLDTASLPDLRADLAKRFPAEEWWQTEEEPAGPVWQITTGAGFDELSRDLPGWNEQFVHATRSTERGDGAGFSLARNGRYGRTDITLGVHAERAIGDRDYVSAALMFVPDATFQPDADIKLGAGRRFDHGLSANVHFRQRRYATADVNALGFGGERYFGRYRAAYRLGLAQLNGGATLATHAVDLNWFYRDGASIGIALNSGREAEDIGDGRVLETDVRGIAINGRRALNERLTLSWWLGIQDQGDYYRRRFLGMAVSYQL